MISPAPWTVTEDSPDCWLCWWMLKRRIFGDDAAHEEYCYAPYSQSVLDVRAVLRCTALFANDTSDTV